MVIQSDVLVIGSGLAGLTSSLLLAKAGKKVTLITKRKLCDATSQGVKGGISAVPLEENTQISEDRLGKHIEDTLKLGHGLCKQEVVENFVRNAYQDVVVPLIDLGVPFTEATKETPPRNVSPMLLSNSSGDLSSVSVGYDLQHEVGHSAPRIFHVDSCTGKSIAEVLTGQIKEHPNVNVYEDHMTIDLITRSKVDLMQSGIASSGETRVWKLDPADDKPTPDACLGAYALDINNDKVETFVANVTFLATGGAGRVYLYTSNNDTATGDGIAMYYRLGYPVANMEFMEFHPTCFFNPNPKNPDERRVLIPEALRSSRIGGRLTLSKNSTEDFISALGYDIRGSAATRDIVAKAIDMEMKGRGLACVYLNVTPEVTGVPAEQLIQGYKDAYEHCLAAGVDMTKDPVPVVLAAHYTCGGIPVDMNGRTQLPSLYAVGETSCTGLHGACRLPNNSLTEDIFWATHAVQDTIKNWDDQPTHLTIPDWEIGRAVRSKDEVQVAYHWDEVRRLMWDLVGMARTGERLLMAKRRIQLILQEINQYYWHYFVNYNFLELRNIALVAEIIIASALRRQQSRGVHIRLDEA